MKRGVILTLACAALLAAGVLAVKLAVDARRPQGTDAEQLQRMLMNAQSAAERRDAAGVTRFISDDYLDALGLNSPRLRYEIRRYLTGRQTLSLEIPSRSVAVRIDPEGRSGTVRFHLSLSSQGGETGGGSEMDLSLNVVKERVYYFWVFPGEEWRVTAAEGYVSLD